MLKSRSDEAPVRRRSLVERTGMKNLMQVGALFSRFFPSSLMMENMMMMTIRMMAMMRAVMTMRTVMMMMMKLTRMCNSECRLSG